MGTRFQTSIFSQQSILEDTKSKRKSSKLSEEIQRINNHGCPNQIQYQLDKNVGVKTTSYGIGKNLQQKSSSIGQNANGLSLQKIYRKCHYGTCCISKE